MHRRVFYGALCLYLRYPQGAAHMDPLAATAGGFHGSTFLRTELAFRRDAQRAGPTKPAAFWNLQDAITRLEGGGGGICTHECL